MRKPPVPRFKTVLNLSCPNQPGIVAKVAQHLFDHGCDIREAQQFDDAETGRFFMRVVSAAEADSGAPEALRASFAPLAQQFSMDWAVHDALRRRRVMILVSKFDHCLADLLYRWRTGELDFEVAAVVSNHERALFDHLQLDGVRFVHMPVSAKTKNRAEAELLKLVEETGVELVVLARYMQILSDDLARALTGRCINIHHSFLPSFKGARPYHQAHARGVKLIGATAHYVTADLDEGPIIEQDVERISHADGPEDMVRKGRDIERRVLARAVRYHLEDRVLLNGRTTVVFGD